MKKFLSFCLCLLMGCTVCGSAMAAAERAPTIYAVIGESVLPIMPDENASAQAFVELLREGDLTVEMHDYGNFEKVGSLGASLPRNDTRITTEPGDVVLYQGNRITIYYDVNSWNLTRLGKVRNSSRNALKAMLGEGDVTVRFSLTPPTENAYPAFDFEKRAVLLNSGYAMPIIGLGTWTLDNDQAETSVYAALKCGMRLIDTARYYGCETGVGRGLRRAMDEGIVAREDVFITSKIMPSDYERAAQGIDDSLRDLGLAYVDLMLIHQPGRNDEAVYRAMEQAVRDGKVRSIGISNYYTREAVEEVLSYADIMPAVIQNENHLYYQNTDLQAYVSRYGIVIEGWYPFGGRGHTAEHFGNETVVRIADAHDKSPAQVILRWQLQAGFIAIPGSSNPDHIAENYDIFDFELTEEDMERMKEINRSERYENW